MTAAELNAISADAHERTQYVQGVTDQARLRGLIAQADAAYTQTVQHAAQTGDWTLVPAAHQALHQARGTQA
ncbi:hypothetical protein ArV2_gp44 [Arthrobacter phage vB_ArS-ArV2]|uniref:Uncharacterized protein n=1 Tax=Arthrobacter phage vB_ArS-ArV2 TaxID=1414742 RepID=V5RAC6_9CAUD|nr:hypothetical protein ArV2_gp44 [Arthrobacter phage vB_ArS-ArV2]AHB31655.1 hypothetical protein ArV2_gp44 [Arthrobacter phage vB_ArS-ArV2]